MRTELSEDTSFPVELEEDINSFSFPGNQVLEL